MGNLNQINVPELFNGIRLGDRTSIARGITLLESTRHEDRETAFTLLNLCLPYTGNSVRIGITGVPGVGKSTFIEAFGLHLCNAGKKVCVLAVDPSSAISGGSILGDKTRMNMLSVHPNAFVRPTPARGTLGGVAASSRESVLLFEAAGYDVIIVETVGVGQSETEVASMTDFFMLLMLAGAGDELQGIKRGIMELCDALFITKADGENLEKAKLAVAEYENAMHLLAPKQNNWIPVVSQCSALTGEGIDKAWEVVQEYIAHTQANHTFEARRMQQEHYWMETVFHKMVSDKLSTDTTLTKLRKKLLTEVDDKKINPVEAAKKLADELLQKRH